MGACGSADATGPRTETGAYGDYSSYEEMVADLKACGVLEDCEIIVGIDCTGSNAKRGAESFDGRNLHDIETGSNPYIEVMRIASKFFQRDVDGNFPLFFFGSKAAKEAGGCMHVADCKGIEGLVEEYKKNVVQQVLSGPTEIVSTINATIERAERDKSFHILLLITDGAVSKERKSPRPLWPEHYAALSRASKYPMAVVSVGVGDGPFSTMQMFDDDMPEGREFDNFQFVEFHEVMSKSSSQQAREREFFFQAFMEIPGQYKAAQAYRKRQQQEENNRV